MSIKTWLECDPGNLWFFGTVWIYLCWILSAEMTEQTKTYDKEIVQVPTPEHAPQKKNIYQMLQTVRFLYSSFILLFCCFGVIFSKWHWGSINITCLVAPHCCASLCRFLDSCMGLHLYIHTYIRCRYYYHFILWIRQKKVSVKRKSSSLQTPTPFLTQTTTTLTS